MMQRAIGDPRIAGVRPIGQHLSTFSIRTPCAAGRHLTRRMASDTSTSTTEASSSTNNSSGQLLQPLPANSSTTSTTGTTSSSTSTSSSSSQPAAAPARSSRNGAPNPAWTAQTAAISVSGPYITTSSIDGDSLIMSADFLERELVGPYKFTPHQLEIIHELSEGMKGCSTAFVAVALAGIALTVAASTGLPMEDAPEVLFNGITVGDVASWVDSLLVAYLLNFGAASFSRVEQTTHEERQLAYTFQGINRLGLMFTQFSIAATTVSIVTTLEAASQWPPLVTLASGLFFAAALGRSGAMWYVLNKYGNTLDDVDAALEAQRRAYAAAHDEALPLLDRLAIRLAFTYLLQYSAAGRRPSEAALSSAVAVAVGAAAANDFSAAGAAAAGVNSKGDMRSSPLAAATAAGMVAVRAGGRSASDAARAGLQLLQKIPLPILSRSTDSVDEAAAQAAEAQQQQQQQQQYVLTQAEERLVQACQSSLNNAGLALVLQAVATGMLVTASMANEDYSGALADIIQVINKVVAAELIFIATTNFDRALYTEGCDVEHLLEGLGGKGITKLFHNLSILAWAVVIAKGVALVAPWEESSPVLKFISENFSHQAADMVLEGQELLVNIIQ